MVMSIHRTTVLADEWLLVRHSGEIPEIAFHSSLYYLMEAQDGPHLQLSREEIDFLQEAAISRYQEIILRDLRYENRMLGMYRGLQRAIFNWNRFMAFNSRQNKSFCHSFRMTTAQALLDLLHAIREKDGSDDDNGLSLVFNCSSDELALFAHELGLTTTQIHTEISLLCYQF